MIKFIGKIFIGYSHLFHDVIRYVSSIKGTIAYVFQLFRIRSDFLDNFFGLALLFYRTLQKIMIFFLFPENFCSIESSDIQENIRSLVLTYGYSY